MEITQFQDWNNMEVKKKGKKSALPVLTITSKCLGSTGLTQPSLLLQNSPLHDAENLTTFQVKDKVSSVLWCEHRHAIPFC